MHVINPTGGSTPIGVECVLAPTHDGKIMLFEWFTSKVGLFYHFWWAACANRKGWKQAELSRSWSGSRLITKWMRRARVSLELKINLTSKDWTRLDLLKASSNSTWLHCTFDLRRSRVSAKFKMIWMPLQPQLMNLQIRPTASKSSPLTSRALGLAEPSWTEKCLSWALTHRAIHPN